MKIFVKKFFYLSLLLSGFYNCSVLHNYSLGEIDNRLENKKSFQVMVSQTGIKVEEGIAISQGVLYALDKSPSDTNSEIGRILEFIKFIYKISTLGPTTGGKVFSVNYTNKINEAIYKHCPTGKITGLRSIRETASYPVITGEIIRIEGYCIE